jgi:hypothetical protein
VTARWIWRSDGQPSPTNTFTWFRTVVTLDELPLDASLRFAADSTAQLWLNGRPLRRKVTRFHEPEVRAELVDAAPVLRLGPNILTLLHHNWGEITTFQRTQNVHAGLYLDSSWVVSDEHWEWIAAEEFESHDRQFLGVADAAPRVRFPVRWNARTGHDLRVEPGLVDAPWTAVEVVSDGPWPERPAEVETPAQRESDQRPLSILAAGSSIRPTTATNSTASVLTASRLGPDRVLLHHTHQLIDNQPVTISGQAGETRYLTVDFGRPVHGYPFFESSAEVDSDIDIGYGELAISPFDGRTLVDEDGWIDVDGIVARGYSDLVLATTERRRYELPDERTARWMTVHITFPAAGSVTIHDLGFVKSQYPIEPRG